MALPTLDTRAATVMLGFAQLNYSQRSALIEWINEYQNYMSKREALLSEVRKSAGIQMMTGPASGGCPCCGR